MLGHPAKTLLGVAAWAPVTAALGLLGTHLPVLQVTIPVLLGVVVRRTGLVAGAGAWAGALALLFFVLGLPGPSLLVVEMGFPGLLLGLLFKNHVPGGRALAVVMGTTVAVGATCLLVAWRSGLWFSPPEAVPAAMEPLADFVPGGETQVWVRQFWEAARLLGPANFLLWAAVVAAAGYFVLDWLFRHWGLPAGEPLAWRYLRVPWYTVWLPISGLSLTLAGDQWRWPVVAAVGKNILYLSVWPFLAVGSAVAAYYFHALRGQRSLRLLFLAAAVFYWPFALVACTLIGALDPVCNWRRLCEGRGEKN
ncbi:MAG: DUF2232 domain-containing protein [Desulfotomaculales bacterium]